MARIGKMNVRARVQKEVLTRLSDGGFSRDWRTFRAIWCSISGKGSDQFVEENQQHSQTDHTVMTRWTRGITSAHRLLIRDKATQVDRILNISSVVDVREEHRRLKIMCREETGGEE